MTAADATTPAGFLLVLAILLPVACILGALLIASAIFGILFLRQPLF